MATMEFWNLSLLVTLRLETTREVTTSTYFSITLIEGSPSHTDFKARCSARIHEFVKDCERNAKEEGSTIISVSHSLAPLLL